MDVSENYIQMCEKASEIQALRSETIMEDGDISTYKTIDNRIFWYEGNNADDEYGPRHMIGVWLPRQDQLQEMLEPIYKSHYDEGIVTGLMDECLLFACESQHNDWSLIYTSMEQLWLAFVMKEKYSKTWNGQEWVK